jgi:hypothetical protein
MSAAAHAHVVENFDVERLMTGMIRKWEEQRTAATIESA